MKFVLVVVVVLALVMLASSEMTRRRDRNKPSRSASESDVAQVRAAIAAGEKIRAVKIYRDATGIDLRSAKDAVDRIARDETPAV